MPVSPGKYNPMLPDIELFDYKSKKKYGLKLDGPSALQVGTISQDDTVHIRTQGKRVGDFDEQRSWKGGRGVENLSSNPEGFWDSHSAWTLSKEHLYPTLLSEFARGLRSSDVYMPNSTRSMSWKQLIGTSIYVSTSFVASASYSADYARIWIKKVGSPGDITLRLHSNSAGDPGTVLKSIAVSASDVDGPVSILDKFDWGTTESLTSGTTYHISVVSESGDNKTNHWLVGGYEGGTGKISADGTTWSSSTFGLYYFVADADVDRTFFSFVLDDAFYLVSHHNDLSVASKLYINGDRGKATAATSTTLTDSGKSWVGSRWVGARVKIVRGLGAGQTRIITANTGGILTVSQDFYPTLDTTSEYVIYGTEWFTEITSTGLGWVSSQPLVVNQIVYFPQRTTTIRRMIWNASTHSFSDDGTNQAYFLVATSGTDGVRIWRVVNGHLAGGAKQVSYATAVAWATSPTNLSFGTAKDVGDSTHVVNGVIEKDGLVYVWKEDGVWTVSPTLTMVKLVTGLEKTPSKSNGKALIAHQQFIYYSWLYSLIRIYGSSHDDIGQDWSGIGLPDGREGDFSSLESYTSLLMAGIDSGTAGWSSVLGWDGLGWHEIYRAYDSGKRIRMVKIQVCPDARNRTWIDVGGDLVFQSMPFKKGSPRLDSGVRYHHEAVVESAAIDMGTASGLPKFVKELTVYAERLGEGNEIHVDYQVDDDVHTSNWTEATTLFVSPESIAFLGLSDIRKFAYRLRIVCGNNASPPDVLGVVPNGYARVPFKMVWTMRCRADNIISKGRVAKPDELMRWLLDNARFPGRIEMRSQYQLAHKFYVIIHPPRMFPYKPAQNGQAEESVFTLTLEEA